MSTKKHCDICDSILEPIIVTTKKFHGTFGVTVVGIDVCKACLAGMLVRDIQEGLPQTPESPEKPAFLRKIMD